MITILLADDHLLVRKGIKALIELDEALHVVGEASDGFQVLELAEDLKPQVVVLDLSLPRLHGLEVIGRLTQQSKTKVLILTVHAEESYVIESLKRGAHGYVLKDASPDELIRAIRTVAQGATYVTPTLRKATINSMVRRVTEPLDSYATLTPRERLVLELSAEGLSNKEIAGRLSISPRTAESHRASIMKKLSLKSQTDLVRFAVRQRIIAV